MDKHLHNAHQAITFAVLNRMTSMTDKRFFDELLYRILRKAGSSAQFADDESGFMPTDDLKVAVGTGGDRSTGFGMKIKTGLGFRKTSTTDQPDPDLPNFIPLFGAAEKTFVTANSDPTDPRMDHVYAKPKYTDGNNGNVYIIDPDPPHNITNEARNRNQAYDYDFEYVAGTPNPGAAGGAGEPSPPSGYVAGDLICKILVLAGSGTIDPSEILDQRTLIEVDTNLIAGVTSLPAGSIVVSPTVLGESDAQSALEALETALGASYPTGLLIGRFQYVQTNQVRLAPGLGGKLIIDCDGTILEQSGALTFELGDAGVGGSHLDTGTEAASTAYYCYVYDVAGTITPKISATAPDVIGGTKPGYHPTQTTWRCIGMFWNDPSGNIDPFDCANGRTRLRENCSDHQWTALTQGLGTAGWSSATALNIPKTVTAAHLYQYVDGYRHWGIIGASDASSTLPGYGVDLDDLPNDVVHALCPANDSDGGADTGKFDLRIADPSNPGFKHGCVQRIASGGLGEHMARCLGWDDPWAPK